jgi:hypothetical protein
MDFIKHFSNNMSKFCGTWSSMNSGGFNSYCVLTRWKSYHRMKSINLTRKLIKRILIKNIYGHSNERDELRSWHATKRKILREERENSINYARTLINWKGPR